MTYKTVIHEKKLVDSPFFGKLRACHISVNLTERGCFFYFEELVRGTLSFQLHDTLL